MQNSVLASSVTARVLSDSGAAEQDSFTAERHQVYKRMSAASTLRLGGLITQGLKQADIFSIEDASGEVGTILQALKVCLSSAPHLEYMHRPTAAMPVNTHKQSATHLQFRIRNNNHI